MEEARKRKHNSSGMLHKNKSVLNSADYLDENTGGLYALIPPLNTTGKLMKVGSTTNIAQRIYQYHGYYPMGMDILAFLFIPRLDGEEGIPYFSRLQKIERYVQTILANLRIDNNTRKESEFFRLHQPSVTQAFTKVWIDNKAKGIRNWHLRIFNEPKHSVRTDGTVYKPTARSTVVQKYYELYPKDNPPTPFSPLNLEDLPS